MNYMGFTVVLFMEYQKHLYLEITILIEYNSV